MREKNADQIIRLDGKNVFLEVLSDAFSIGKVQINFCEYDPNNGNKQIKKIPIYIDIDKFLVLCHDIMSGKMAKLAEIERADTVKRKNYAKSTGKEDKYIYCKEIYDDLGGIGSESLAKKLSAHKLKNTGKPLYNFEIPSGQSLSRQFKITPGDRKPWILSGEQGLGKENDTKLIVPQGKSLEIVRIPLENDVDLKKFAKIVEAHIDGFISAQYVMEAMHPTQRSYTESNNAPVGK